MNRLIQCPYIMILQIKGIGDTVPNSVYKFYNECQFSGGSKFNYVDEVSR